jgi:excisionase family DNA binding protein
VTREALSLRQAARVLGVDRGTTLAQLIRAGTIRTVTIGTQVRIARREIDRVLAERKAIAGGGHAGGDELSRMAEACAFDRIPLHDYDDIMVQSDGFADKRLHVIANHYFRFGFAVAIGEMNRSNPTRLGYYLTKREANERAIAIRAYKAKRAAEGTLCCDVCGWTPPKGAKGAVNVHHIVPLSHGGDNQESNLCLLCPNHHSMAHKALGPTDREELVRTVKELEALGDR